MANPLSLPAPVISSGALVAVAPTLLRGGGTCDALDPTAAGGWRACRRVVAFLREGHWGLCRDHAYNAVTVDAKRRRA